MAVSLFLTMENIQATSVKISLVF